MAPIPNRGPRNWVRRATWSVAVGLALLPGIVVAQPGGPPQAVRVVGLSGPEAQLGFVSAPMGVAVSPGDDGRVFVVDRGNARIQVFTAAGGVIGSWGSRGQGRNQFFLPSDIALSPDGRYAYVVDQGLRQVKRFDVAPDCFEAAGRDCFLPARVVVFGWDGDGPGGLQDPTGLAVGRDGRVYVADAVSHRIVTFDADGSPLGRFGKPGSDNGELLNPTDVAVHPDGSIWVADSGNDRICFFSPDGQYQGQWAGTGKGRLFRPTGLALDAHGGFVVRDFEQSYQLPQAARFEENKRVWSISLGGDEADGTFPFQGVAFMPDGSTVLTDPTAEQDVLKRVLPDGTPERFAATRARHPLQFDFPLAVALDRHLMAVVDAGNRRVVMLQRGPEGERFKAALGLPFFADLDLRQPAGVAVRRLGEDPDAAEVYITDAAQHSVYVVTPAGDRLTRWGDGGANSGLGGFKSPHGIAIAPGGDVLIADTANNRVVRRAPYPRDAVLGVIGRSGSGPGELEYPIAVTVGPGGLVYVIEAVRNRLQAFTLDGAFVAEWRSGDVRNASVEPGEIWMPQSVGSDGQYLYLLENDAPLDHVRVQVLDPRPGVPLGDSLVATFPEGPGPGPMQLWNPRGVAVGPDGMIAVADSGNNRIVLYRRGGALPPTEPPPTPTAMPTATVTAPPTATDPPPTPTDPPPAATPTPTQRPSETPTPLMPDPATPTALPSGVPPSATPTTALPGPTNTVVRPSPTPTDPPSANTRPTPYGGGKKVFLPLSVRNFRVGSRWR